jgi:CRISPR/Cas system-associated exonuclease Cas4 (RecB family)
MTTKPAKKITSWSYSRWACYTECPAKAKYKFIDKLPEPGSPAMERGNEIHKMAENYVKGVLKTLPAELKLFSVEIKNLKKQKASPEQSITFTKDWKQCAWNDWDRAWLRIKVDAILINDQVATVIDYKTGKVRDGNEMQLSLYDLGALVAYPKIKVVMSELWYLDHGEVRPITPRQATQKDVPLLKKEWVTRVTPMLNDTKFAPRAGDYCRYCTFRKGNGGPCQY